jgi:glyoxylase-like metal-dependent hydrolase (beta-lactamase superfamily II)
MFSPGHTLASITYVAGDAAFVHDTLMVPDSGTSRADFPGRRCQASSTGASSASWPCPTTTRLFVGHDYAPNGREPQVRSDRGRAQAPNIHLKDGATEAEFVKVRTERDQTLPLPKLMLAACRSTSVAAASRSRRPTGQNTIATGRRSTNSASGESQAVRAA